MLKDDRTVIEHLDDIENKIPTFEQRKPIPISEIIGRPLSSQMMVLGSTTINGTVSKVENLADALQACFDAGAKKILLPMSNEADIATVPSELLAKFQTSFYASPEDATIKALGIK